MHPGLIKAILEHMRVHIGNRIGKEKDHPDLPSLIFTYLRSRDLYVHLETNVRLIGIMQIMKRDHLKDERVVVDLVLDSDVPVQLIGPQKYLEDSLVSLGLLSEVAYSTYAFPSPLHRLVYFISKYGQTPSSTQFTGTVQELVIRIISCMDPVKLKKSKEMSVTDGRSLERVWQMEFYRSATSLLPANDFISPDVPATYGKKKGFIDFYINDNWKLAIEILREGNQMQAHENRFKQGGLYANFVAKNVTAWLIIDFRSSEKRIKMNRGKTFIHVSYDDDFSHATISIDGTNTRFALRGGNAVSYTHLTLPTT
eukprot:TRINITY_DN10066_c0_g1_i1.p1 TRINITY_DN10066_c0_g1~~TRINITY_DN10066_c0_g1_i1.p1  ORF type:complete len:312 (-),score=43.88 TRINITY_DN10066_c0_g1_i1:26-961(-)